jgi:hypothetical protein
MVELDEESIKLGELPGIWQKQNNRTLCLQYSLLTVPFKTEHPEEACPTKCSNSLLGIPACI